MARKIHRELDGTQKYKENGMMPETCDYGSNPAFAFLFS